MQLTDYLKNIQDYICYTFLLYYLLYIYLLYLLCFVIVMIRDPY